MKVWTVAALAILAGGVLQPASAQPAPDAEKFLRELECRPGNDCGSTQPAGSPKGSKRNFKFVDPDVIEDGASKGKLPSSDVEIEFAYNSTDLLPQARLTLDALGHALTNARLANNMFVLVGHTDAKGSDSYNQTLSEKRASAVRQYLVSRFAIDPARLHAYGRGKTKLKTPVEPFAAANRRVQVVNAGTVALRAP